MASCDGVVGYFLTGQCFWCFRQNPAVSCILQIWEVIHTFVVWLQFQTERSFQDSRESFTCVCLKTQNISAAETEEIVSFDFLGIRKKVFFLLNFRFLSWNRPVVGACVIKSSRIICYCAESRFEAIRFSWWQQIAKCYEADSRALVTAAAIHHRAPDAEIYPLIKRIWAELSNKSLYLGRRFIPVMSTTVSAKTISVKHSHICGLGNFPVFDTPRCFCECRWKELRLWHQRRMEVVFQILEISLFSRLVLFSLQKVLPFVMPHLEVM